MTSVANSPPIYPFLAALPGSLGTGWTVDRMPDDSGMGSINIILKQLEVPLSASARDRNTRMHELFHGFLSRGDPLRKAELYRVRFSTYQAVEDARMHYYITVIAGLDLSEGFLPEGRTTEAAGRALDQGAYRDLALMLVSGHGTAQQVEVCRVLGRAARRGDAKACQVLKIGSRTIELLCRSERPSQQRTGQAARMLERDLKRLESGATSKDRGPQGPQGPDDSAPGPASSKRSDRSAALDKLEAEAGPLLTRLVQAHLPRAAASTHCLGLGRQSRDFVDWGTLEIEEPPLNQSIPRNELRHWRSSLEGWRLRGISRLLTDRRVFGKRRRRHDGAVLIDVSGSMSLSKEQVWEIVKKVPGAVVASYAGNGVKGKLRVLCRQGQVAGDWACLPNFGRQNVVDLPALEWLAKQRGPLVWISDGQVTGCNDHIGVLNHVRVEEFCKRHSITRVMTVAKAIEAMQPGTARRH